MKFSGNSHSLEADNEIGSHPWSRLKSVALLLAILAVVSVFIWQGITAHGNPDPTLPGTSLSAATLDIAVLVFREGLECILVLSAITASMTGGDRAYRRPITAGVGLGLVATLLTWFAAVGIVNDLGDSVPALALQAGTGLLAIIVLLVVMNWFFHKTYWGGWISLHNRKKKSLLASARTGDEGRLRIFSGLALLGFSSLYREGFEVVLFLQSYRLRFGTATVTWGALCGTVLTAIVAALTFAAHRRLPYRKMLVLTGVLLALVLVVMVGEEAQEMQLAHWLPTTPLPSLDKWMPGWLGLWFSVFPTIQTLLAQLFAVVAVAGSYLLVRLGAASSDSPDGGR